MKTLHNAASGFFVGAVAVLSVISILGVWDFFSTDVITKSFQTIGLLAIIAVVIIIAGRFMEAKPAGDPTTPVAPSIPNPVFKTIRQVTVVMLIVAAVLLALVGIMAIWDVITDQDVLYKAISSLGILVFSSFVIVITCLEREDSPFLKKHAKMSGGGIVALVILAYICISLFFTFLSR